MFILCSNPFYNKVQHFFETNDENMNHSRVCPMCWNKAHNLNNKNPITLTNSTKNNFKQAGPDTL